MILLPALVVALVTALICQAVRWMLVRLLGERGGSTVMIFLCGVAIGCLVFLTGCGGHHLPRINLEPWQIDSVTWCRVTGQSPPIVCEKRRK